MGDRMKNWLLLVVLVGAAAGCGDAGGETGDGGRDTLLGKWVGSAAGMTVSLEVATKYSGVGYYSGTLSTSNRDCFTVGMLVGRLTQTTIELSASGSGAQSQLSIVRITGELERGEVNGLVSMTGDAGALCEMPKTWLLLRRQ
jgi:hypothetical protein